MAKGSSNSEALNLQREQMRQSQLSSDRVEMMLRESIDRAKTMKLQPVSRRTNVPMLDPRDASAQLLEQRRDAQRRSGLQSTIRVGGNL